MASIARIAAFTLGAAAATALTWSHLELRAANQALVARLDGIEPQVKTILGEVTRIRIERKADKQGPEALLERLKTYAPMAASARTTQPDYKMALDEIDATLRAFESIGKDAYGPVIARFRALDPGQDFDEMNRLLEAATRTDKERGMQLASSVLQGSAEVKPTPRLRWAAANLLLKLDQPLAQSMLRRIVLAESWRGRDPQRAVTQNLPTLDAASIASTGFSTFMVHYLRSEDPETEETLLQVLNRADNDVPTIQEMVEWLGEHRSTRADKRIEELYHNAPGAADNALFLNKCLDALAKIRGDAIKPFLEQELAKANNTLVAQHIGWLLKEGPKTAFAPTKK